MLPALRSIIPVCNDLKAQYEYHNGNKNILYEILVLVFTCHYTNAINNTFQNTRKLYIV